MVTIYFVFLLFPIHSLHSTFPDLHGTVAATLGGRMGDSEEGGQGEAANTSARDGKKLRQVTAVCLFSQPCVYLA
jgi:hypothetical protein